MIWWLIGAGVIWVACGVLAHAFTNAYFVYEYREPPWVDTRDTRWGAFRFGLTMVPFGPVALLVCYVLDTFQHGLKWGWK